MEYLGSKVSKSYYHCLDTRYPLCPYTLPELLDRAEANEETNQNSVIWYRPYKILTYKQCISQAKQYAKGLLALGIRRGDVICCFGSSGYQASVLVLACAYIGVKITSAYLYTPVQTELADTLDRMKPVAILSGLCTSGLYDEINYVECFKLMKKRLMAAAETHQVAHFFHDEDAEEELVSKDPAEYGLSKSIDTLLEAGKAISDDELAEASYMVTNNEPFFYVTTSGSTGKPKSVLVGGAVFANGGARIQERLGVTKDMTIAAPNLCALDFAHVDFLWASITTGCNILIYPHAASITGEDAFMDEMLLATEQYKPTFAHLHQWYMYCLTQRVSEGIKQNIDSLKGWLFTAGVSSDDYKRKVNDRFPMSYDWYGLSEFFVGTSSRPGQMKDKPLSCGKPFVNIEVKIVDEKNRCVPLNTKGEVLLRGYAAFIEYQDNPEATKQMFDAEGWMKTGDCGFMDEDGDLTLVGRMNDYERIKLFGDIVYLAPIESQLKDHPKIKECCVVGIPIEGGIGHANTFCIVPKQGENITVEEIKEYSREKLRSMQWPWRVIFFDALPKTGRRCKVKKSVVIEECKKRIEEDYAVGMVMWREASGDSHVALELMPESNKEN